LSFLLDTNVISESAKPRPDAGVLSWLATVNEDEVFLSVITLAELRHGVERMPVGARRSALDAWATDALPARFANRLLPIDPAIADQWGRTIARGQAAGRPLSAMDAFIAATAERHRLTLVTRNVSDFEVTGIRLLNPWDGD
jgi:predicted nucleic acid-binding protein